MADQKKPFNWNGNEGEFVTRKEAGDSTRRYRESASFELNKEKKSGYLGGKKFLRLLSQEKAVGLRIYYGYDAEGNARFFIVGVDSVGNDILDADNGGEDLILDRCFMCPPFCPDTNELNQ